MVETMVIGIDCATQANRIGLARGSFDGTKASLDEVLSGGMVDSVIATVGKWILPRPKALIAMDAPLGWPELLGSSLVAHVAGEAIPELPNYIFRRETDRFIKSKLGKTPLDVGADRIARTAHAALRILEGIRFYIEEKIPLVWGPDFSGRFGAIEVYPAGTLTAYQLPAKGYKGKDGRQIREQLLSWLFTQINVKADRTLLLNNPDVLDAAFCVLAGFDFIKGNVYFPENKAGLQKEGWIWVRKKLEGRK